LERLTPREYEVLADREFLYAKRQIHHKVMSSLRAAESPIREEFRHSSFSFPPDLLKKAGKISHGENYLNLPYWVLDYPRKFLKNDTFAFRTMVWWGHEISCTLHISGSQLHQLEYSNLMSDFYFCIHHTPWEYHFAADNYLPARELSDDIIHKHLTANGFVKIARKWPLDQLYELPSLAGKCFGDALISLSSKPTGHR
jgi:hypothetical protein